MHSSYLCALLNCADLQQLAQALVKASYLIETAGFDVAGTAATAPFAQLIIVAA